MRNIAAGNLDDLESIETSEWFDSLDYVLQSSGPSRAGQLLQQLSEHARRRGIRLPFRRAAICCWRGMRSAADPLKVSRQTILLSPVAMTSSVTCTRSPSRM